MNATAEKFAVELRKIDDIRPYERNPRINDQAVDAVATSLAEFGLPRAAEGLGSVFFAGIGVG